MTRPQRAREVLVRLRDAYPGAHCALVHRSPFELLVATILSAQCTDERVNKVTPGLFRRFPDPGAMAAADPEEVSGLIRSTGFFRSKTKSILGAAGRIEQAYGGAVPRTMDELLTLPGVARKTANVVLGTAFGRNEGVVVDTHVQRLSQRMGLTGHQDPARIERDLMDLFPREEWTDLSHRLILHGRLVCNARLPRCAQCVMGPGLCPSYEPDPARWRSGAAETAGKPGRKPRGAAKESGEGAAPGKQTPAGKAATGKSAPAGKRAAAGKTAVSGKSGAPGTSAKKKAAKKAAGKRAATKPARKSAVKSAATKPVRKSAPARPSGSAARRTKPKAPAGKAGASGGKRKRS